MNTTTNLIGSESSRNLDILIDILKEPSSPWIDNIGQTDLLCKTIKFLFVFLHDTPFRCTEIQGSKNILKEVKFINDEALDLVESLLSTKDHVPRDPVIAKKMDLQLSLLLQRLEVVEERIKECCAKVFKQRELTIPNLTSVSMYIVDSSLDDLNHLLIHKADFVVEVEDQIKKLYDELYSSRSMLRDIELQQSKELVEYEMQLIDIACQVEYIIGFFVAGDVPIWYLAFRLANLIKKSNPIRASLTKVKLNLVVSGVQVAESSGKASSSQVTSTKSIPKVDEIIVGFKETTRQIAEQLFGGSNNLEIISIVGMGGLGKTTLAIKLYNHSNVVLRFHKRAWCVVSQTYQRRKLLTDILSSVSELNKKEISEMEDHQLVDRIYKSLKETRYLLVVDDIWEKNIWDDLKRYFPNDTNGSRILFTSRSKDVALQASPEAIIHDLPLLTEDQCWDLLQKKVFPNSFCPQELQDVGKEIVKKCKGLPLVVVGIAAVMANMDKKKSLWEEVATNLTSYVSKDQNILELSYEHLPSHLKPCFLYLGMFREDEEISARKLLSLWVCSGFIPKIENKVPEDIAEDFLRELINRSLVQVTKRRSDNGIKTLTMHDLIRDMCVRLADKEKFFAVINGKFSSEDVTFGQHHHICARSRFSNFDFSFVGQHFRSFLCESSVTFSATLNMKRLRVLLTREAHCFDKAFESLVQLRHVEFARYSSHFWSHMNLEVLHMVKLLDRDIQLNMPKLRHLNLRYGHFFYFPLKHLHMSHTNGIQTLSGIIIENLEDEERLRCFSHLRRLKCEYQNSWKERSPDLIFLTELVSLNLRCLKCEPQTINFPIHIKKLSISNTDLSCRLLSSIGTLPHLEILKLYFTLFESYEGMRWRWKTNNGEFQNLKFLKLEDVLLHEWNPSEDHFPVLEHLVFTSCRYLGLLPSELGYIQTLQMIEVSDCNKNLQNSTMDFKKEQEEAGNELLKITISGNLYAY